MKAIVQDTYGPPEVLTLREIDRPAIGDNDVLIRVHAAGVDPGVWHLMTGRPYLLRVMGFGLRGPKLRVRGSDVAGQVEAVGSQVTRFKPGDNVYGTCDGAFAEYASTRQNRIARMPASLTYAQAAAIPISACAALHGLRDQGQIQAGQRVLILGAAGGVGTYAVQLAKIFGAHVTGVCRRSKMDLVRSLGADEVIDYTSQDVTATDQRYDLVLDMGGNRSLLQLRRVLAPRGTLVLVGGEGGGLWLGGFERMLFGAPLLSPFVSQRLRGLMSVERTEDLEYLATLIEAGTLRPIIDRTYPLREAPDAIRYLSEGQVRGKVVVQV